MCQLTSQQRIVARQDDERIKKLYLNLRADSAVSTLRPVITVPHHAARETFANMARTVVPTVVRVTHDDPYVFPDIYEITTFAARPLHKSAYFSGMPSRSSLSDACVHAATATLRYYDNDLVDVTDGTLELISEILSANARWEGTYRTCRAFSLFIQPNDGCVKPWTIDLGGHDVKDLFVMSLCENYPYTADPSVLVFLIEINVRSALLISENTTMHHPV